MSFVDTETEGFIPTRRSLLSRLRDWGDRQSWQAFYDRYRALIHDVASKAGLTAAEAQDVVQDTMLAVAKKMPEFRYDPAVGSFKGWLLQLTRWRIQDHLRKKQYQSGNRRLPREQALGTTLMESQPDISSLSLERIWNREWEKYLLQTALDQVKRRANPRQFQLFHLHVVKNVPAQEVARRLSATLAEVYFARSKLSLQIRKEIRRLEQELI
jgi:RNA polymerase sigma-70 factor (ECF subfamily)